MGGKKEAKDQTKKATKKGKKKDPNAPKRSKSAYMFFCDDKRPDVKKKHPDLKMTDVSKKLAELWKECHDKKPFEAQAAKDKERYEKAKKEYEGKGSKKKAAAASSSEEESADE